MPTPARPAPTSPRGTPAGQHAAAWNDSTRQREALLDDALDAPLPPPIERGKRRAILLLGAGLIMAAMLVVVVLNVDRGFDDDRRQSQAGGALDPGAPPPDLGVDNATAIGDMHNDLQQFQTERGWIQATQHGRLAQEYRYARSEPAAGGRLHMTAPEVKIYLEDNRVLSLRAKTADVAAPSKALESGTMNGEVLIRLYELSSQRQLDEAADVPVLEVRTEQASFDNFQGEVLCPGEVDIQTQTAHLPARGLRMHINDVEGRPGQITIERTTGELRLSEQVREEGGVPRNKVEPALAQTSPAAERQPMREAAARPRRERDETRDAAGQRPRERRNRMPSPEPIHANPGPYFYRLTLSHNVRIRQGDGSHGWTVTGDQMHMIFSLDSDDLGDSLSWRGESRPPATPGRTEPMSRSEMFAALLLAASQDSPGSGLFQPADNDTIITCDGPLTMVPLVNAAEQPQSIEDSRFELLGSPVVLHNNEDATNITCAALQYASLGEVLELIGSPQHRLIIDSPDLHAEASRFWVDRLKNVGAFEGAGWMAAGEEQSATAATQPAQTLAQRGDARIMWNTGVDLEFRGGNPIDSATADAANPHDSFGRLQRATFKGEVDVATPDFTLDAQTMVVGFPDRVTTEGFAATQPAQRLASLEFIHATTSVVAGSLSDGGTITCEDLRVDFTSHEGKTVPVKMLARQNVAAVDQDHQTVWAEALDITFRPTPTASAAATGEPAASQPDDGSRRRADVDRFTADGGVQILMADGARVFADHLEADGEGRLVVLTGEDVMVVSDRSVLRRGRRLELTERGEGVTWPGSGEFAYFANPVLLNAGPQRVVRPVVDEAANPRQMLATWTTSLLYDGLAEGGAGSIDIHGDVNAQSTPTALELNTMTGDSLRLLFAQASASEADQPAASMPATAPAATQAQTSMFAMDQGGRRLRKLIATGNARLESRTWQNADRSDKPRVFWLAGQQVNYDDQTLEAFVPGGGELLVRDERPDPVTTKPDAGQAAPKADLPFGARGTTHFRWTESLRMTRSSGNLYDINLLGGIEVRHRALDQSLSTMTGDRLEAVVDRAQGDAVRDAGFDLGGSMDLRRIHALGNVYVDSPTRDVDCDEFDFDYTTGIAQLKSAPGRMVTVVTAGNPHPVQARSFSWNTVNDTVQAMGISGSSGR